MSSDINKYDIICYTDGSSKPGPRRGGIAVRLVTISAGGTEVVEDLELLGYKNSTNNEMELRACIAALEELSRTSYTDLLQESNKIIIRTDSQYVRNFFSAAKFTWPKTRWTLAGGAPVSNAVLWKDLVRASTKVGIPVEIEWVKGHAKDMHNKAVDKAAKKSADNPSNAPLVVKSVRRRSIEAEVSRGSVKMEGQDILIRVRECEKLKVQKIWKLKYEVIDVDSPYFGCVDIIFSNSVLRDGHIYAITLGKVQSNPRVEEVLLNS